VRGWWKRHGGIGRCGVGGQCGLSHGPVCRLTVAAAEHGYCLGEWTRHPAKARILVTWCMHPTQPTDRPEAGGLFCSTPRQIRRRLRRRRTPTGRRHQQVEGCIAAAAAAARARHVVGAPATCRPHHSSQHSAAVCEAGNYGKPTNAAHLLHRYCGAASGTRPKRDTALYFAQRFSKPRRRGL